MRMSDKPTISSFEDIFNAMSSSLMIIEDLKNIVWCNRAFYETTGYTPEDMKKVSILDLIHEEDRPLIQGRMKILSEGGEVPSRFRIRFLNRNGSVVLAQVTGENILYDGKPARIMAGINISAEPLIEQSPELVKSLLNALTHHSELGYWVDDMADHTIFINEVLCKILGYSFDEIRSKTVTDFLHPSSRETYNQILAQRLENDIPASSYELILINSMGKPTTFRVIGSLLYDEMNNPIGSVGFFTNIEATKKLSLVVSTLNRYALFSRYKDLSSFWKNVLTDILDIFYAQCGMVFLDGEIVAQKGELSEKFNSKNFMEELAKKDELITHLTCDDCSDICYTGHSIVVSILLLNRIPAGFMLLCSDIPDLFSPEDIDLFTAFCSQITLNYEHHFLYIESEEEREFVSVLLDILSHDFLNANTSVHGYLELLNLGLETQNTEQFGEYVERSIKAVERSERILQIVQNLTKIQKERKLRRVIAAKQILENAIESQTKLAQPREVNISLDCSKKTEVVAGDLLQNVFENVINNAIKFTKDETVKIEVECDHKERDEGKFVEFRFKDYGVGISDEAKLTFLKKLVRGDSRFQEGVGLGLYLARVIVEVYEGFIIFENRVPDDYTQGTIVKIQLPMG